MTETSTRRSASFDPYSVPRASWVMLMLMGCSEARDDGEPAVAALAMLDGALDGTERLALDDFDAAPLHGPARLAAACDPEAEVTAMDVCGREVAGTLDFAWDACTLADDEALPGRLAGVPTSGSLQLSSELTGACDDETVGLRRTMELAIDASPEDGATASLVGTVVADVQGLPGSALTIDTTVDLQRSVAREGHGITARLQGHVVAELDQSTGVRTLEGTASLAMEHPRRGTSEMELSFVGVERGADCRWPVAGTIERTHAGEVHSLVLGPACGEATLDGEPVELDALAELRPHDGAGRRGGGRR